MGYYLIKNQDLKNEIKLIDINGTCPKIAWYDPKENYTFNFSFANGGKVQGTFDLDINTLAYVVDYKLDSLNLDLLYPYVEEYMQAGSFAGLLSSEQRIYGNFNQPEAIAATGKLILNSFLLTTPEQGELVKIKEVKAVIDTLNVPGELYNLSYISFLQPVLYLEIFEEGNNFTKLLNEAPSDTSGISSDSISRAVAYVNIFALMATYIRELSENYAISNYKADSLVLREGSFIFNDNTLHSKFNYVLEDLMVKAERVNSEDQNITFVASSILNTSGHMEGSIAVNPEGFRDMDIEYSITGLNMTDFTPYADFWIAHPFTSGICNYRSQTSIKNRYLTSNHKLEILNIVVGKKQKNNTAVNLPFRFAVSLLKDVNGNIRLELPVEGDLEDPKYKVGQVVWQIFKNLINKAVAAPGKLLAKKSGVDENDIQGIVWNPLQIEIEDKQRSSLDAISKLLKDTPEISLEIINIYNKPKEEDELALWEGKKLYLFREKKIGDLSALSAEEEMLIKVLSGKDSVFNVFLDQELKLEDPLVSVYDKAKRLVGRDKLNSKTAEILTIRNNKIFEYLAENGIDANRISVSEDNGIANVPYSELSKNTLKYNVSEE